MMKMRMIMTRMKIRMKMIRMKTQLLVPGQRFRCCGNDNVCIIMTRIMMTRMRMKNTV